MEKAETLMMSGEGPLMKVYSIPMTGTSAAPIPNKVIQALVPGQEDLPGPWPVSPNNSNIYKQGQMKN